MVFADSSEEGAAAYGGKAGRRAWTGQTSKAVLAVIWRCWWCNEEEIVGKEGGFGKVEWPQSNENQLLHLRVEKHGCIFLDALACLASRLMKNWEPSTHDNKARGKGTSRKRVISRSVYLPAPYLKQTTRSQKISILYNALVPMHSEIPRQCLFTFFL